MKRKNKNVAILIPELGGGGAERVASILGDMLVPENFNVIYFLSEYDISFCYDIKGIVAEERIGICYSEAGNERVRNLIRESLKLRAMKKKYHIDISISFMEELNYLNILSKGHEKVITRICTILSDRKTESYYYDYKYVHRLYNHSDAIVVMSQYAYDDLSINYHINKKRLIEIPNPAIAYEMAQSYNKDQRENTIIFVGRMEPVKQPDKIIRAFSVVKKKVPDAKLVMLGQGPLINYLEALRKKYKVEDSVRILGFVKNVDSFLDSARVFVMSSKVEGFPNAMVEAMAHKLPVVSMDSPGACGEILGKETNSIIEDIVYAKYGVLTPYSCERKQFSDEISSEEKLLADALVEVINNKSIAEQYAKQSEIRAKAYTYEKVKEMWLELLGG